MKKIILLLLLAITCKPQNSFAQSSTLADTVLAFVISNEAPGYLIDNLIANGYGDSCLYSVLVALQPISGGVITDAFLDSLYTSNGDDIFNYPLSVFSDLENNPIVICMDGTAHIASIYGRDYYQMQGFNTYNDTLAPVGLKLFTYATGPEYYIDAGTGSGSGYYTVFAIAWSLGSTFLLSNEGGLIDDLIRAGLGTKNLYQTLEVLKPKSGGVISDEFMAILAKCPAGSEIFTAALNNFGGLNNPICVNTDGTLTINGIFGKDYLYKNGYTTLPLNQGGYTSELFTYANSAENYIDAGSSVTPGGTSTNYKAFAIAWKLSTTFVLSNEGGLIDDLIRAGHGDKNLYQTLEVLKPQSGGVISDEFMATLAKCPAGSEVFTASLNIYTGINSPVGINTDGSLIISPIFGKDFLNKPGYSMFPENKSGYIPVIVTCANSVNKYIDTGSSIDFPFGYGNYKAFAIAWKASTTFVLTNEGGLIDDLIDAGHGTKNLYQVLEVLKPKSGGVISDDFMAALANCPAGSEIFITQVNNYTGLNNPVCINTDGTCNILGIFGNDYHQKAGYFTWPEQTSAQKELFTVSNDFNSLIEAGFGEPNYYYKAFAIAWSVPTTDIPKAVTSHNSPFVYPNPFRKGFYILNLPVQTRIEVFDLRGKLLYQTELKANSMVQPGLLSKGIYILKLINSSGSWQQKIVKY